MAESNDTQSQGKRLAWTGWIYFIYYADFEAIKIGYSKSPGRRLRQVQTSLPGNVQILATMPGTRRLEADLHKKFFASRFQGEWFDADEELLRFIVKNAYPFGDTAFIMLTKLLHEWEAERLELGYELDEDEDS